MTASKKAGEGLNTMYACTGRQWIIADNLYSLTNMLDVQYQYFTCYHILIVLYT